MIFTRDFITHENRCRITLLQTKTHYSWKQISLSYVLHATWCPEEHTNSQKQSSIAHFAFVTKDSLFILCIVTSPQSISDITWILDTGIVTYLSIVCACANWHKADLHYTPFTQGLRPFCLHCATTKLARSPLKAEKKQNSCLGRSMVVHRTFRHRHGRHGRRKVLSMFKTVAQRSLRRSVAHR